MFTLDAAPKDKIFGLIEQYEADTRTDKVNLTNGVYKDETDQVPVLDAVKRAEERIWAAEKTKVYLGIAGDTQYRQQVLDLTLGADNHPQFDVMQAPGGTGALRILAEFIRQHTPDATIWISNPTWANHHAIFNTAGLRTSDYAYYNKTQHCLAFDNMMTDLDTMKAGDYLLLHAVCHNPTGADLNPDQWDTISECLHAKGVALILDCAYAGFAQGIDEDMAIIRYFVRQGHDVFIANSFSKNFGLYNERTGALCVMLNDKNMIANVVSHLKKIVRAMYSNPPAHGAKIVATILSDAALRQVWHEDLNMMNQRLHQIRQVFATQLSEQTGQDFNYIRAQNGLFSSIDCSVAQAQALREDHGVYILDSGRINVAGINQHNLDKIGKSITAVY